MRLFTAKLLLSAGLFFPVTEGTTEPTPAPTRTREDEIVKLQMDLEASKTLWESAGIKTYQHTQSFSGLVGPIWLDNPITVKVENEKIVSATFSNGTSVDDVDFPDVDLREFIMPINELFDFIDSIIEGAFSLTVTYDELLGYPSYVYYQEFSGFSDRYYEPIIFTVSNLVLATCPSLGCCVEDCCGDGTTWNASVEYCVEEEGSAGFNGTYVKMTYLNGCVERACCEADCCGQGTQYDLDQEECRPGE